MILQGLFCFIAVSGFSILFKMPRKEIFFCGLNGSISWMVYVFSLNYYSAMTSTLISVVTVTIIARILASIRKIPLTIYAVAGIMPLVPGSGIYNTMYMIVTNNSKGAYLKGLETIKTAFVISMGMIIILSLPSNFFKKIFKK